MPELTEIAKSWIGTPFMGGCWPAVKRRGADCGSFIAAVLAEAGRIELPAMPKYDWAGPWARGDGWYEEMVLRFARRIDAVAAGPGDIVLYRMGRGMSHGGIVMDWPRAIIHADSHAGVVMAAGTSGRLAGREHRIYRLKEASC